MAIDLPPLLQPPLSGILPSPDWRKSEAQPETDRPVEPSNTDGQTTDLEWSRDYASANTDEVSLATANKPSANQFTKAIQIDNVRAVDQARPIYNPRGAPTDATPALSRLDARIAFEPLYMHQYASTRYALVSFMPWAFSERRTKLDILA